jgi:hypothetical protein
MVSDHAAGITEAMMNIDWSRWEPLPGVVNASYVSQQVSTANQYRANGWTVAVDIGLQSPPSWVLALPNGQLIDQNGQPSGSADYEYSQAVRTAAATYILQVVAAMGPVASYRIGVGSAGEMMYPEAPANQWWGFSEDAQHGGLDLPAGVPSTPMPGWVPGTTTWDGANVTGAEVSSWYGWYYGALVNTLAWEIRAFRTAGFGGELQLLLAGDGALPEIYDQRLAADLAPIPTDEFHTMNTGVVFWKMLPDLAAEVSLANAVVDITGVYDGTGTPRGNACEASDSAVSLAQADPWNSHWSDTRWVSYLSRAEGLTVMGENPGNTLATDVSGTINLARGCGLTALQWAWDWQLHGTDPSIAQLPQLAAAWAVNGA